MKSHPSLWTLALGAVLSWVAGCAEERLPEWAVPALPKASADASAPAPEAAGPLCAVVRSAEPVPARYEVTSPVVESTSKTVFVSDLFGLFRTHCGACHVDASQGEFGVSATTFAEKVDTAVLDAIFSSDPKKVMPPLDAGGKLPSERSPSDPVNEMAALLKTWIDVGRPRDVFYLPQSASSGQGYLLSERAADHYTNIGNCVPSHRIVGLEEGKMRELDARFESFSKLPPGQGTLAERIGLPESLAETDLFTLESETLARHGVIAYAPAYPLWSDGSGKIRHIRVPHGTSIRFDKEAQSFDIPPNTRFYKTFLKQVRDVDGNLRWRKIETRVIVARPDIDHDDGSAQVTALFGTYVWNDEETEARLLTDPLRNAEPFRDRLVTIVTDEEKAAEVRARKPRNLTLALEEAGALRRYAIPGSARCVNCHMGSPTRNFQLGFIPLQVHRRRMGQGGVFEPAGRDELTQLQRFIDYGLITGMQSPDDLVLLESSQGERKPRNDYELTAQGYMLGNCAHCHNPRGFPSVTTPALAKILDFLPSRSGGIFQFPLEATSPRIFRGVGGAVPMPYITPSLMDYPSKVSTDSLVWTPKWRLVVGDHPQDVIYAPWRSLLWRAVDTPFPYSDDLALIPHMPLDTAGFDCRAPRILGDWMVSIPAKRKSPELDEYAIRNDGRIAGYTTGGDDGLQGEVDENPQPYVEVRPGEPGYEQAQADADKRLFTWHEGKLTAYGSRSIPPRYEFCPDTSDIVDPAVVRNPTAQPVPIDDKITRGNPPVVVVPLDGVPNRAHWVISDLTDPGGAWAPRRLDWKKVLVDRDIPEIEPGVYLYDLKVAARESEKRIVELLQKVTLRGELSDFAKREIPFGTWVQKGECDFSKVPRAGSFKGDDRPRWMRNTAEDAPVYSVLPGEAVYQLICQSCHGVNADSRGRQADVLLTMSGGEARVANFRTGLFGKASDGTVNRDRVFGEHASPDVTAGDLAVRYLAWMGLGGTSRTIPSSILNVVADTDVLGVKRARESPPPTSANMLATAQELCREVLPSGIVSDSKGRPTGHLALGRNLVTANGDAELWERLCSLENPPPLRALRNKFVDVQTKTADFGKGFVPDVVQEWDLYPTAAYPPDAPVGDHRGQVVRGIHPGNRMPWCLRVPRNASVKAAAKAYVEHPDNLIDGKPMPFCPESVVPPYDYAPEPRDGRWGAEERTRWADRGAINAGVAVFLYLDAITSGTRRPTPRFDQCELLAK